MDMLSFSLAISSTPHRVKHTLHTSLSHLDVALDVFVHCTGQASDAQTCQ